jgi:NAD+ kinase
MTRVAIIASPEKHAAGETMDRLMRWLKGRAEVVFAEQLYDAGKVLRERPDLLFVLGGDGTLIGAVHMLREKQLPIIGINLGKLGYLAEFTIEQIESEGEFIFEGELPITRRVMLRARLEHKGDSPFETMAVNDCVVLSGPPFRMVELTVEADGDQVFEIRGDGLIIATASGSTAHNLSAGGPILEPTAEAIILTPICPHALTFRPLAMDSRRVVTVRATRANEGTTVAFDGHVRRPLQAADQLVITRHPADFLLVRNPRRSVWHALRRKLMWGQHPQNGP